MEIFLSNHLFARLRPGGVSADWQAAATAEKVRQRGSQQVWPALGDTALTFPASLAPLDRSSPRSFLSWKASASPGRGGRLRPASRVSYGRGFI